MLGKSQVHCNAIEIFIFIRFRGVLLCLQLQNFQQKKITWLVSGNLE